MRLSAVMVSPSAAKLEEGWCEMATAKPKVKRMMVGGAAKAAVGAAKGMGKLASQMGAQMQTQRARMIGPLGSAGKPSATPPAGLNVAGIRKASAGLGDTFPRKSAPPPAFPAKSGVENAAAALRKLPMNPPRPGTAGPKPMQSSGRTVLGSPTVRAGMAGKSLMKKGGAVKKATKK